MNKTSVSTLPSKQVWILMGFLMCCFAYLIMKDAGLPKVILFGGAFAGGLFFLFSGLFRRDVLTYILVTYIPFSFQLPVAFGNRIPGLNLTNLLIAAISILWYREAKREGKPLWAATPLNKPLVLFMALGMISIFRNASYGGEYLAEALHLFFQIWIVPVYLYFLIAASIQNKETIKNIVVLIMMVTTLVALMAVYDYIQDDEGRVRGVFDQPNFLAAFFCYYMFLPLGFAFMHLKQMRYWPFAIATLICFRGIMVTMSRAGYLAFAVGLYAVAFFRSKVLFVFLMLATLFLYHHPVYLPEGVRYRFAQTLENKEAAEEIGAWNEDTVDASAGDRIRVWKAAVWMIREHPVWGIGFHLFESKILHYYTGDKSHDPHNTYLLIASEMGIPALLLFLWILILIFWNTRCVFKTTPDPFIKCFALGLLGGIFALIICNIYGDRMSYPSVSNYFWILAALMISLRRMENPLSHE